MKKLLFVIGSLQVGGAETVMIDLINNIYKNFDITVLLIEKKGELLDLINPKVKIKYLTKDKSFCKNKIEFLYNKIKLSLIYRYLGFQKWYVKKIYKKTLNEKYDKEIAYLAGIPSEIVSRSPNKESIKISWIHADISQIDEKGYLRYLNICNSYNHIVCVSQASLDAFEKIYPEANAKTRVLYNYIDVNKIIDKSSLEKISFNNEKINIISVGRLSEEKAFDRIINVAKKYEDKIEFNIIGDGPLKEELNKQIITDNINNVKLLGLKKNPYPYIKAADVFLLSSRTEAYPTVLIEALVLNKSIIASLVSGVEEILGDYENKIIFPNEDSAIEFAIDEWLKNKPKNNKNECNWIKTNKINLEKIKKLLEE
ncbi:MAG: glycosyltransferase [Firmicutes bacterium]|nr:glycosyltransferase [Bacillota bacterium]